MNPNSIVGSIQKRMINDMALEELQKQITDINTILSEKFTELEMGIADVQKDTQNLQLLKNKLLFIEQFYIRRTSFETEIDSKIGRIEHNLEVVKKQVDTVAKDMRFMKEHYKTIRAKNLVAKWKIWKLFTK